jgi:5-methyltetrahydropteroyltriglutamate--homocysteine methyltransferase
VDNEANFSALDSVVGDGDFGFSLARGFEKVLAEFDTLDRSSVAGFLKKVALIITSRCGGTSGPIWGTAFLRAGASLSNNPAPTAEDVIAALRAAIDGAGVEEAFLSAASPGVVAFFLADRHYGDHEAYLYAIADAMKVEYDEIHRAGLVLQLDCPDLTVTRHRIGAETLEDFRRFVRLHVEAIDHATRDIPPEALRMHVCWGNYEGPHHYDVPLRDIVDIVLAARPAAVSFEAANPRHAHEWTVFEDVALPDGKVLVPGVLDTTTNYIEHPELVAQRIVRYARLVGRESVIAGTDCGFASFAGSSAVDPKIVWAKLRAMAEGAEIASKELY